MARLKSTSVQGAIVKVFILTVFLWAPADAVPKVTRVTPQCGSKNGGTLISTIGGGFSRNYFNFGTGNDNLGSKVTLTSAIQSFECTLHPDGSHETQITCYTTPMPVGEYTVKVTVDGQAVPDNNYCDTASDCVFKVSNDCTPTIDAITPTSGMPGEFITITGNLITSKYGSNEPNDAQEKILRVYFGGQKCELRDEEKDVVYGISFEGSTGSMMCKTEGTYIGNNNVSFLISNAYGRSMPSSKVKYVRSNGIAMYQTFTEIAQLSQKTGSIKGGTRITISGQYFDDTDAPVKVQINDEVCKTVNPIKSNEIVCDTPAQKNDSQQHFPGNRGFYVYIKNGTTNASSIDRTTASVEHVDQSSWSAQNWGSHAIQMVGYFVPVYNGTYRFCVKSASTATVYMSMDRNPINKVQVTQGSEITSCLGKESNGYNLEAGKQYYTEVQYGSSLPNSYVNLVAHLMDTTLSAKETGFAEHEIQDLKFSSVVTNEIQKIEISTSGTATLSKDVQTMTITGNLVAFFALGLDGAYTVPMQLSKITADIVKTELKKLPSITFDVLVAISPADNSTQLTITTNSSRGAISNFEGRVVTGSPDQLEFNVERTTIGKPDLKTFTLVMDGVPSDPISVTATANDVKTAVEKLLSVRCHPLLSVGSVVVDYETPKDWIQGRVSDDEPFCGKYLVKNPTYIYHKGFDTSATALPISTSSNRFLCFAYKGLVDYVNVYYEYKNTNNDIISASKIYQVSNETPDLWSYSCKDIYSLINIVGSKVQRVLAVRQDYSKDLLIDQLMFHREAILPDALKDGINLLRMPQAQPNGVFFNTVSVSGQYPTYLIQLNPHHCGYNIPLFQVASSTYADSTYTVTNSGSVTVKITSVQTASPPIGGKYSVTFKGDTTPDPVQVPEDIVADTLIGGLGTMSVGFSDVVAWGTCSAFTLRVTMLSQTGDQPLLEVDGSQLTGYNATVQVQPVQDGGLWLEPIMGDLLRTYHTSPQVIAFINNVPTRCKDKTACTFNWDNDITPLITAINPTSGSLGHVVEITGSGFESGSGDNNQVFIGNTVCNVTTSTSTKISCTVGNGPTGDADVKVNVKGKGLASGLVQFQYITNVTSLTPSRGSVEGGTILTISGYGFTPDAEVTVMEKECQIVTISESMITCRTPRAEKYDSSQNAEVNVTQFGSSLIAGSFQYNPSLDYTPVISSISQNTSSIWGGDTITIEGDGFGDVEQPVLLGGVKLVVNTYSNKNIVAKLPPLPDASYQIIIDVKDKGYADLRTHSISDIVYTFKVTGMTPTFGSLYGGTDLTITGVGFSTNNSAMDVNIGPHHCNIANLSETQIVCRIADTGIHHAISATGIHKVYGYGYAWDKDPYTINVGDYVTWHWETPQYVSDIGYGVHQTETPSDLSNKPGGFSSGEKSRIGTFTHHFTTPGVYYYWSGFMDSEGSIYFRGTIKVEPLQSSTMSLSVKFLGFEAVYDTSTPVIAIETECPSSSNKLPDCTENVPLVMNDKFYFQFLKCYSPYINSISRNNGTFTDNIILTGDGLGTENCQNEVKFADSSCKTLNSSTNTIEIRMSENAKPPIGVMHEFTTRVGNIGYALVTIADVNSQRFGLLPQVDSISPAEGSKVGGTKITISGAGFVGDIATVSVELDSLDCIIKSVTYTEIVCVTSCGSAAPSSCREGDVNAVVKVAVGSVYVPAICEGTNCTFTFSDLKTANVTAISPNTVSQATTQLTITGTKFGTAAKNVQVKIGDETCTVDGEVSDTEFKCTVGRLPVGENFVYVSIAEGGLAETTVKITSEKVATIAEPAKSSTNGGALLVIQGNGFVKNKTEVNIGGSSKCPIVDVDFGVVTCTLPAHVSGTATVTVISRGITYDSLSLVYSDDATPQVNSISPTSGTSGETITITGNKLNSPIGLTPTVKIGGAVCNVTQADASSIECTAGPQMTGQFDVEVLVAQLGLSNTDIKFTYNIGDFEINPSQGSTNGGQVVTLTGSGFLKGNTTVSMCGAVCQELNVTKSQYTCRTTGHAAGVCDVVAQVRNVDKTKSAAYTYNSDLDSSITSVNPVRGGTGGGTLLTISGTNFGVSVSEIHVEIAGVVCDVKTVSDTQITCETGPAFSVVAQVEVQRNGNGLAKQLNATYQYIDVWSSPYTWGNATSPGDGEFVIIPAGKTILLDVSTGVLKMLLIQGGKLIFDEKSVELKAENILITDGGLLQVGSADKPFPKEHKAIITMYGHLRSKELPVYGAKTLAVREGTLNLYGNPVTVVWTRLASTAEAGTKVLTLQHEVDWKAGDEIVIATTGDRHSQKESEVRVIESVSGNQVTLTEALTYKHLGIEGTFDGQVVEFRAEVGLLTRNVVVRGDRNTAFDYTIPACPNGFDTGEFATQTCFQGRFGEEIGSDQFGAQIMVHQMEKDTQVAQAHIQYTELTYSGQAFRLGRYAIHFHRNGNMDKSFVRGCSIHTSFNRAVNIHGSHNILVENNVIYDIRGGAFFLEDGDETGNIFQYNLAIFVRSSTSLRNDDITPAAFWATNPNNTIRHNAVAGGTHFGTWYRMHLNPDGPGFDPNICPQSTPLAEYRNNTAHSLGWFGLWIFETYVPRKDASCSSSAAHNVAKFYNLTAWNCDKGAESVNSGAVQFHHFVLVNNENAGFEGKLIIKSPPQYDPENGPGIFDTTIVAHYNDKLEGGITNGGIVIPYQSGLLIQGVKFHNFDKPGKAAFRWTRIAGTCMEFCGGFTTETNDLKFFNSPNKVRYDWESEGVLHDQDGSLTGSAGFSVVPFTPSLDNTKCVNNTEMSVNLPGCVCSDQIKFIRFSFNKIVPSSLDGKNALFTTEFGTSKSPFAPKRITHPHGWAMVLMANHYYQFSFQDAGQMSNISYDSVFYHFDAGDFIAFTQHSAQKPDIFMLDGSTKINMSSSMLSGSDVSHGQWFYNDDDSTITYAVKKQSKRKRAIYLTDKDISIKARMIRCYYLACQPPLDPMDILTRPEYTEYWSSKSTWANVTKNGLEPEAMDDLTIPKNKWILVDKPIPKLGKLVIEGGLEFLDNSSNSFELNAEYIHITGRLIAGWSEDSPFKSKLVITLRGNQSSPSYPQTDGPSLGAKFIGVFGGLQLHGEDRGIIKTKLAATISSGNQITVADKVAWVPGDVILITTTDYNPWHTETFTVNAVSDYTITLNDTIKYKHIAHSESVNGVLIDLSATVALLTRNIRIEGEDYPNLIKESFGARVIVGQTSYAGDQRSGFAQISNVEFFHTGQEGFSANYDARFSITYSDVTSTPGKTRYSYVKKSSFYSGFNTAIGVFAVDGLEVDNNIVHHTVGAGIRTEAKSTQITNNLVALSIWPGSYLDRQEKSNPSYEGAIEAILAENLVLANNTVAGSERIGFHVAGQFCNTTQSQLWSNNVAIGGLIGVCIFPEEKGIDQTCVAYSGFTAWKNLDFGIYYNNPASVVIKKNVLVENGVSVWPAVIHPSATLHVYEDKFVEITDNIFIGKTSTFSETLDVIDLNDDNIKFSDDSRGHGSLAPCGKIGVEMTSFSSGSNKAPTMSLVAIMSYPAIKGITILKKNSFVNFRACTGTRDYAITTNKNNDDGNHPLQIQQTTLVNVEATSKLFFHPPNVNKINPADCVDMDCDALKKCMIQDLDGTFLGHVGTALPDSAYEWDGNRQHGLGDYRIPTSMLTTSAGKKIDVQSYAPHKGIYKTDNCTWIKEWRAYDCGDNYSWRLLIIESMDYDTETRRLSPVAIYNPEGYVDLINGPQDHGWCSGYTCQKRLSTFQAIVALNQPFDIFLTSTNPNVMRYMLLNSKPNECVRLGMYYTTQNRLEVRVNGTLVMPTNGYLDSKGAFRLKTQETTNQWMPDVSNKINGQNFQSRAESMVFWIQCGGSAEITVTQAQVIVVSFTLPAMTEDEFFGAKIVENLAAFLNVDPRKVRIVNIVRATSSSGRRKRDEPVVTFVVEIGDEPGETPDGPTFDFREAGTKICHHAQVHGMSSVLNATVLYTEIYQPNTTDSQPVAIQKVGQMIMQSQIKGNVLEGQALSVQPKFKVLDEEGNIVENLNISSTDWIIEATIKSGGDKFSKLLGSTRVTFVNGWANFTDLAVFGKGDLYTLQFSIVSPPEATNFSITSNRIEILGLILNPSANLTAAVQTTSQSFNLRVGITEKQTGLQLLKTLWTNLQWKANVTILSDKIYTGSLSGTATVNLDTSTATAVFSDLTLDQPGTCPVLVTIVSEPPLYTAQMVVFVNVMTPAQKSLSVEEKHSIELKFDIRYDESRALYWATQVRNYYSAQPEMRIVNNTYRRVPGSLFVSLQIEATKKGFSDTLTLLCSDISSNKTFTFDTTKASISRFMTVDDNTYFGVKCGDLVSMENKRKLDLVAEIKTLNRLTDTTVRVELSLQDLDTKTNLTDLSWGDYMWTATAVMLPNSPYQGNLSGDTTVNLDPLTGKGVLGLKLDKAGKCPVLVTISSKPNDYKLTKVVDVDVMTPAQANLKVEEKHGLELKFDVEYNETRAPFWAAQVRNYYSQNSDMRIVGETWRKGSLIVTLLIEATASGYKETLTTMCSDIKSTTTFTFDSFSAPMVGYMKIDNIDYVGGNTCGEPVHPLDKELETKYIIIIVVLSVVVVALVVLLLVYKFYLSPHAKTSSTPSGSNAYVNLLYRDDTSISMKSNNFIVPHVPPAETMLFTTTHTIKENIQNN